MIDGHPAMLRVAKPAPRLDCPENYLSLYIAHWRPDGASLYVAGQGRSYDDLVLLRSVVATIRSTIPR